MPSRLDNKVALVTGAGQGIGQAIAQRLAAEGARVAVLDLNGASAERTAAELPTEGLALVADVSDPAQVQRAIAQAHGHFGRLDILVNNAGWSQNQPFLADTPDYWQRVIGVNYLAVLAACHAALPLMQAQGGGRIISIASDAGRVGTPKEACYAGAKAAVMGFSRALAVEAARDRITVNVVSPATTDTPLVRGMLSEEQIAKRIRSIPLGRLGQPADIAAAVAFFASDDAAWITGQVLSVNGGMSRL